MGRGLVLSARRWRFECIVRAEEGKRHEAPLTHVSGVAHCGWTPNARKRAT